MRQIGVRDEAKMLGGYGSCGRPLCCTTWLNTFEPVSIKMAKQQQLSLNPSKLSGQCGRLKCCLRYELPNGNGVKHGGCAEGGHCSNPTGCGTGGCDNCSSCGSPLNGCVKPRIGDHRRRSVRYRSGNRGQGRRRPACGARRACRSSTGLTRKRRCRHSRRAQLSADAGRAAYDAIVAAAEDARNGRDRRHRDRADQQGSVRARRPAVEGAHRSLRLPLPACRAS